MSRCAAGLLVVAGLALLAVSGCATIGCDPPRHMVSYKAIDGFPGYRCVADGSGPVAPPPARSKP